MAQFKSRAGQPFTSQRIDGQVWSASGPGATIRGWVYPTMSPSAQFVRLNGMVIASPFQFASLSSADQLAWAAFRRGWQPAAFYLCFYDFQYYSTEAASGEVAFKAVNNMRALQGLAPLSSPPVSTVGPASDVFSLGAGLGMPVTWSRAAPGPMGGAVLTVYARAKLSSDQAAGSLHKQKWVGCLPIVPGVPVDVGDLCRAAGQAGAGLCTRLLVLVGEAGSYPFASGWLLTAVMPAVWGWGFVGWGSAPWGD